MHKPTITVILQVFKRPQYLKEQLAAINRQTIKFDKLIIVHNEGSYKFNFPENAQIVYASPNMKYHLRFVIGLLVDTEYIAFYDDDTIPCSKWIENCIETIEKHDCICVTNGRIIDRKNKRQYGPGWSNPSSQETLVDFGGHSIFMKQKNLKYMFYENIIEYDTGEDVMLSANCQRFGNVSTYVPPHPLTDKSLWGSDPEKAMKFGNDSVASYYTNPTHNQKRYNLFDEYAKRGWKLLLEKNEKTVKK